MRTRLLSATVLICTYNRSALLRETLESLKSVKSARLWQVVVVDNNSTDDTRQAVEQIGPTLPVPVIYLFEGRQGKSFALNTGIERSQGDILVFTDDDVRVAPLWLEEACGPLDADPAIDYTGGPVRPRWGGPPPAWLDQARGDLWGTLAILDYGDAPFVFEERWRVPLGANMAVRRTLIERIGGFHTGFGRRGGSLLGQEQAEFLARGRVVGARGLYVPGMEVEHYVPAGRLTKRYFRRWWFWKGISRARVDSLHRLTELGLDLREVPYVARVPRFVWGLLPRALLGWLGAALTGDRRAATRHEMHCAYVLGYIKACWSRHEVPVHKPGAHEAAPVPR